MKDLLEQFADLLADKLSERMKEQKPVPQVTSGPELSLFEKDYDMNDLLSRRQAEILLNLKNGTMDNPRYNKMCEMVKINNRVYFTIESVLNYKKNHSRK